MMGLIAVLVIYSAEDILTIPILPITTIPPLPSSGVNAVINGKFEQAKYIWKLGDFIEWDEKLRGLGGGLFWEDDG